MKAYKLLSLIAIGVFSLQATAQEIPGYVAEDSIPVLTEKDSVIVSSWMVGVGINAVENTGDMFSNPFNVSEWNMVPFPSRINIGRYFRSGIGIELIGSYNKYQEGKFIDGIGINPKDEDYFSIDSRISYDLNKIIGETAWFDPYIGAGLGYTNVLENSFGTYNAVAGFRIWFSDRIGLDVNTTGKWDFEKSSNNHLQYGAGITYQFDIEKDLSKKGEEKAAMIRAIQANNQRLTDSIAAAKQAEEEARLLAERQAREKREAEQRRLEAEEQARKQDIRNQLDEIGAIYFAFNSSYLNEESKNTLDQLAALLIANSELTLEIESHTDARGTDKYNNWLSGRRAAKTTNYLQEKHGIDATRINAQGLGESQLTNNCDDGVRCTEEEHRANRRSEFRIVEF